jgi:hypothetical protein
VTAFQQALLRWKQDAEQAERELDEREFAVLVACITVWAAAQNARYLDKEATA